MFVYDFVQLDTPFGEVRDRLLRRRLDGLGPSGTAAHDPRSPAGPVIVEFDRAVEQGGTIAIPFHWRPQGPSPLFTAVDGHLQVSRLGDSGTHVSLLGNYRPPGVHHGRRADRMQLHHLVEGESRALLGMVADRLVEEPVRS